MDRHRAPVCQVHSRLPMHLPGCPPAMADGSFSLAGHLLRSPGGSTSRLHSIEAILGFTKEDGILDTFPAERSSRGSKERDPRLGARSACPKAPAGGSESSPPVAPGLVPEFEGECAARLQNPWGALRDSSSTSFTFGSAGWGSALLEVREILGTLRRAPIADPAQTPPGRLEP